MKLANTICSALKHLRKIRGKTQEEVYLETGISVCNYETNKRTPTLENLIDLCNFYEFEMVVLMKLANASVTSGIPVEDLIDSQL